MIRLLIALCVVSAANAAMADNLVANPGFEVLTVDQPQRWEVFVQPQPGASGTLAPAAHTGDYAVMLHTPRPYDREPLNNWSQNILQDGLGGKTLRAEAVIKVAEVTEAAIWVQCWRRRPWSLIHTANSSFDTPVYGTQDWQQVSMTFEVPAGTDYLTVRCVLIGTGSAWFDDVTVTEVEADAGAAPVQPAAVKTPEASTPAATVAETVEPVGALVVAVPMLEEATPETPVPNTAPVMNAESEGITVPAPVVVPDAMAQDLAVATEQSRALAESVARLEASNRALLGELVELREELLSLQGTPPPAPRTPPLVPHGTEWQEDLR